MDSGRVTRTVSPICQVSRLDGDGHVRFVVEGEVDASVSAELFATLVELGAADAGRLVHFDLSGLTFCAVSGVRVFAELADQVGADGGRLMMQGVRRVIRREMDVLSIRNVLFDTDVPLD
jgi:anti-anti-sigma factor